MRDLSGGRGTLLVVGIALAALGLGVGAWAAVSGSGSPHSPRHVHVDLASGDAGTATVPSTPSPSSAPNAGTTAVASTTTTTKPVVVLDNSNDQQHITVPVGTTIVVRLTPDPAPWENVGSNMPNVLQLQGTPTGADGAMNATFVAVGAGSAAINGWHPCPAPAESSGGGPNVACTAPIAYFVAVDVVTN